MKVRELHDGEHLQVGDIIVHSHALGRNKHEVFRVTKKYAKVHYNDIAVGRYPIEYGVGFTSLPRPNWPTVKYHAYRKIEASGE